jgi:hypothetical protein
MTAVPPTVSNPALQPGPENPVSLNQFFPFVMADPMAKRREMGQIRRTQGVYTPAVDYWRLFRLQVAAHHQFKPGPGPDALDTAVELAHPDRKAHYLAAVSGYRKFLGRKRIEWLDRPRRGIWLADDLRVRVNPELHVTINDEPHVVKLYLKADPKAALNQRSANPMAYLLHTCHGHLGRPLVVDVLRGRAFGLTRQGFDYESMLRAQAAAFVSLWGSHGSGPATAGGSTATAA